MVRSFFLLLVLGTGVMAVNAQSARAARVMTSSAAPRRLISGTVSVVGAGPLEGVLVSVKGGAITSGSQQDGQYYIDIPVEDSVLVFSLDGYQTQEVHLADGNDYSVVLRPGHDRAGGGYGGSTGGGRGGSTSGGRDGSTGGTAPFSAVGLWRGVFEIRQGVEVPFGFEVRAGKDGSGEAFFHNAEEWFKGGRVLVNKDSFFIELDQFDNELAFPVGAGNLTGVLRRQDRKGNPLAVRIEPGKDYRFEDKGIPAVGDISGTYDVTVSGPNGKEEKEVGIFRQQGNKLAATFLRITGDSRYLEGIVEGHDFYLSSFIGSGPSYFRGSFAGDGRLTGESVGVRGSQGFTGVLNPTAALPDAYKLTYLRPGYSRLDFSFPDVDGYTVSLADERFKNKVVIVTIGGTWCPNCIDETAFLAPWYLANRSRGIEVVSIQYERQTDSAFVRKVLGRMRDRFGIGYTQVFGGIADKQAVAASLPALNSFLAFPTTLFIDRQGRVAAIHTGFNGPATGRYYQDFIKEFNEEVNSLVKVY